MPLQWLTNWRNQLITKNDSPSDTKEKVPILVSKVHKKTTFGTTIGTQLNYSSIIISATISTEEPLRCPPMRVAKHLPHHK